MADEVREGGTGHTGDLGPSDVGRRVVVRRFTGEHVQGRPQMTDVLGELVSADATHLVVRRRDGAQVRIERTAVVAAKVVPPPPPRRPPSQPAGGAGGPA